MNQENIVERLLLISGYSPTLQLFAKKRKKFKNAYEHDLTTLNMTLQSLQQLTCNLLFELSSNRENNMEFLIERL